MKKKYYNYSIFFALIFLVAFSFIKKNNFIIFTISPIGSYQLRNIEIINSELERYFLIAPELNLSLENSMRLDDDLLNVFFA